MCSYLLHLERGQNLLDALASTWNWSVAEEQVVVAAGTLVMTQAEVVEVAGESPVVFMMPTLYQPH